LKTLRLFCLGICAYQKYRQFHFLDYLRLMARLRFNSAIQLIKANARGFRNFVNYRARILFHCGKLNLAMA